MILDNLNNSDLYCSLHPLFAEAFDYLKVNDFKTIPPGKHEIKGDNLFALVSTHDNYAANDKLEAHRKYIDIQFLARGTDVIGWKYRNACTDPVEEFDEGKDVILYRDKPGTNLNVDAGSFVIFYPDDAHAPLMGNDSLVKVVIKVKI